MSFSSEVKAELCRAPASRRCCAVAEAYGVLLYSHTYTPREIRIVTASERSPRGCPSCFTARSACGSTRTRRSPAAASC